MPAHLDFTIKNDPPHPRFPTAFSGSGYFDIEDDAHLSALKNAAFANVKIVNSLFNIEVNGQTSTPLAYGDYGPAMVVTVGAVSNPTVLAHEYGHTQGLEHREDAPPFSNPGEDEEAIMHFANEGGVEINRNERGAFAAPIGQPWRAQ